MDKLSMRKFSCVGALTEVFLCNESDPQQNVTTSEHWCSCLSEWCSYFWNVHCYLSPGFCPPQCSVANLCVCDCQDRLLFCTIVNSLMLSPSQDRLLLWTVVNSLILSPSQNRLLLCTIVNSCLSLLACQWNTRAESMDSLCVQLIPGIVQ